MTTLLAVLLVAQTLMLVHAYEHDVGSPQNLSCSSCLAAQSMDSACVDTTAYTPPPRLATNARVESDAGDPATRIFTARQRAPPACS